MEDDTYMITDNDYKRELERFLGYKLGFEWILGRNMNYVCLCVIDNGSYRRLFKHNWSHVYVKDEDQFKYKSAFEQLIGEKLHCGGVYRIKLKNNKLIVKSYYELCILNDLMGN